MLYFNCGLYSQLVYRNLTIMSLSKEGLEDCFLLTRKKYCLNAQLDMSQMYKAAQSEKKEPKPSWLFSRAWLKYFYFFKQWDEVRNLERS